MTRREHARRMVSALDADTRLRLQVSPLGAMRRLGLTVKAVNELTSRRGAGGMCDGMSFTDSGTVLYAPTQSRRENFTLAHEYAHLLVNRDDVPLIWLADAPEPAVELERLCDDIAGLLLVPEEAVDRVVGPGPVRGQHVFDLFHQTNASQVVCAIALARRLNCTGAVLLTDRAQQTVVHAAVVGEPTIYPRAGQLLPTGHPLRQLAPRTHVCRESFWATPWGERSRCYLDAVASDKRTYAVLADLDLWQAETLHLPGLDAPSTPAPQVELTCRCGYIGPVRGWPCETCGRPFCSRCKDCDCSRRDAQQVTCDGCFLRIAAADVVDGRCSECRS